MPNEKTIILRRRDMTAFVTEDVFSVPNVRLQILREYIDITDESAKDTIAFLEEVLHEIKTAFPQDSEPLHERAMQYADAGDQARRDKRWCDAVRFFDYAAKLEYRALAALNEPALPEPCRILKHSADNLFAQARELENEHL